MAANEPHAYVAGEIIECMACSDNVVRLGQNDLSDAYSATANLDLKIKLISFASTFFVLRRSEPD